MHALPFITVDVDEQPVQEEEETKSDVKSDSKEEDGVEEHEREQNEKEDRPRSRNGNAQFPVIAQFCANKPEILLGATRLIEDKDIVAVDINFGCPQGSES